MAWRAHVDQIKVGAINQRLVRIIDVRNAEGSRGRLGQFPLGVGNGHQLASGVASKAWEMGSLGPGTGAKNADANAMRGRHVTAMISRRLVHAH